MPRADVLLADQTRSRAATLLSAESQVVSTIRFEPTSICSGVYTPSRIPPQILIPQQGFLVGWWAVVAQSAMPREIRGADRWLPQLWTFVIRTRTVLLLGSIF